ncbi:polysaccharide deacetylase family protein [Anaerosacchariphilus polymeriproducens]|uniref:Deacetylase n=1 Tax=Anaerosacchariphilus polymeriproducens TaxID=1812858 RepID=A0A371AZ16_9FIRM|nr:deacetylase [Anaerosacchariphilus polymeriproducens]RDU24789.1 deacetylase [Anaerosacchariphilus polymeriproducens]
MKKFIITVDTEGDNLWSPGDIITTKNAKFVERFQRICEKYCFIPTYLVNYEMAMDQEFVEYIKSKSNEKKCEVGMHLHAWNNPPIVTLQNGNGKGRAYLIEFSIDIMKQKIQYITELLQKKFDCKIHSHRAGRWAINKDYMKLLKEEGYLVDCSVTPFTNWKRSYGHDEKFGGVDFRKFPCDAYEMSFDDIRKTGETGFFEVPMTIAKCIPFQKGKTISENIKGVVKCLKGNNNRWLRPDGTNLQSMLEIIDNKYKGNTDYIEFMIHSSELMPAGSPTFDTEEKIEKLYEDLEILFSKICLNFEGIGLTDYAKRLMKG